MFISKKGKCFPVAGSEKGTFEQTDIGCSYICGRTFALLLTQPKQLYPIRKYSSKTAEHLDSVQAALWKSCSLESRRKKIRPH